MLKERSRIDRLKNDIRVGFFLAKRELLRSNKWTTGLIIFVMMLTFLNLVVVSGILVGIIRGSIDAYGKYIVGDIVISPLAKKTEVQHTPEIVEMVKNLPGYKNHVIRYTGGGSVESDYRKDTKPGETRDKVGAIIYGIDPEDERKFSSIADKMLIGSFLEGGDLDQVVIGSNLVKTYTPIEDPAFKQLKEVEVGSKVLISIGNSSKEYVVKGILKSKVDFDTSVIMLASEYRKMSGQDNLNASQISMHLTGLLSDSERGKRILIDSGVSEWARVQLLSEGIPKFVKDMENTFAMLGAAISFIGLVVSSITIFIVIFVNAITRRRFIGILKGVGISNRAIEISYVLQAILYAVIGSIVGLFIVYTFLKPGLAANPIDFPFSDGVLAADFPDSVARAIVLLISTIIAGFIPARMIVKQNTLSAILGR
jgi:ABC-type lipoprotein release transport system permease subunit